MAVFNPRGLAGIVGTMLFLIALFLVLNNYQGAVAFLDANYQGGAALAKTLQGR